MITIQKHFFFFNSRVGSDLPSPLTISTTMNIQSNWLKNSVTRNTKIFVLKWVCVYLCMSQGLLMLMQETIEISKYTIDADFLFPWSRAASWLVVLSKLLLAFTIISLNFICYCFFRVPYYQLHMLFFNKHFFYFKLVTKYIF